MGSKRPFADVDSQDADQGPDSSTVNSSTVKRRKQFGKGKHKTKEGTSEFAKKRARNIDRLLQRKQDLPANVRNELERELAARKADIADKSFHRRRSAMIAKYHMVRFFERKKASRLVKQLKRQMQDEPDCENVARLKEELHVAEVDEAYTMYHPHVEPYIGLYGNIKAGEADEDASQTPAAKMALKAERPPMWSVIEKTMEEGSEALKKLRERRPADDAGVIKHRPKGQRPSASARTSDVGHERQPQSQPKRGRQQQAEVADSAKGKPDSRPQLNRRERRRLIRQAMPAADDDDDGDFFEQV